MQGPGGGRDPFFDFGGFGGFGSFGPPRSLISSFFGGRDPFSDPFFAQPFGGMFESSPFGGPTGFPFPTGMNPSGFLEHPAPGLDPSGFLEHPGMHPSGFLARQNPEPSRQRRGPIIQELDSDEENDDTAEKKENPRKHGRSDGEPSVEHPDDEIEGKKIRQAGNESRINIIGPQPQSHSFCFQSSTVSYGGPNGLYYTSSRTRRSGSDGVTFEERKEADSSTMQASHLISRGIHGKGHSLSRNLNSDGRVDTRQTLLNINEDELAGFEEQWKEKGQKYLPGWTASVEASGSNGQAEQARSGGWALPSSEYSHTVGTISEARDEVGSSRSQERVLRTNSSGRNAYRPGVGRRRH
ncbi:hypothetical protein AAZX31_17G130900 [Glycine max]|uniref:Glycine-rich protein n=2 Tax=Glycine subgen. Soja TaxID=1462606 RepID=I1MUU6_SOYBN|nr:uncharacterized protein LOC100792273 [Glycine max]XP_006600186.1 uncharacterized protein LOC100792273 isoform X1 [Glycine max]XP_006600187.1 uncharacterized protein LOC100792273 isoform X1 [Glycine max]XP_014624798.1 uncharacterized protein LOC100792273 isoform X1 [Glycine max]XP_028211428.1 uncharacterized protein LOC114394070 [Glycine soja]XP_028211430.1 uncharacterized protein LOC114394070 [Glycine soja]XP_028211431.1 uncharacterized protein LOC114394070 [Glycine soja]KAG4930359.1 hypo|eukprot:NP_001242730.2 uncharacterized protein LOC100792273 [Glycine max]